MGSRVRCFVRLHGIISNRRATRSPLRRVVIISCATSKLLGIIIQPPCPPKPSVVLSNLTVFLLERRLLTRRICFGTRAARCALFLFFNVVLLLLYRPHIPHHTTHHTQDTGGDHTAHRTSQMIPHHAPHPTIWGAGAAG